MMEATDAHTKRRTQSSTRGKSSGRFVSMILYLRILHGFSTAFSPNVIVLQATSGLWANRSRCYQDLQDWSDDRENEQNSMQPSDRNPIPAMPSQLFQRLARSQLELLANSILDPLRPSTSKIDSMALYLPQENAQTGQLEFVPAVLYPDPSTERVFVAPGADSGVAPTMPKTLTKLPGFAHATTFFPRYPMLASSIDGTPGVGVVEEVMCDPRSKSKLPALSVPLLSGSQTVGVLLVSPSDSSESTESAWGESERQQVSRAAQSLSMALLMDNERNTLQRQNEAIRDDLSDSLHQVKNPLQALRTYGKLLQRIIASTEGQDEKKDRLGSTPELLGLAESLITQSERVADLIIPMDSLVDGLESAAPYYLNPASDDAATDSLVVWQEPQSLLPWETETLEFARENATTIDVADPTESGQQLLSVPEGSASPVASSKTKVSVENKVDPKTSTTTVVGDMELEMVFVVDVLEPILSAYHAIASERGIEFEVGEDENDLPGVVAAPRSLQEAVSNVIDNAFKYVTISKPDSPFTYNPFPKVRVRFLANDRATLGSGVTIIVEDNGPGIKEGDRMAVFERGFRSETVESVDGTGIGLYICKKLLMRMGGVLEVGYAGDFEDSLDGAIMKIILFRKPKL